MSPRKNSPESTDIEEGILDAVDVAYGDTAEARRKSLDELPPDSKDRKVLLAQMREEERKVVGRFRSIQ